MDTVALNSGIATSIADSDLVAIADPAGSLKPISFANLMKAIREDMGLSKTTSITLNGGEWVRIAKTTYGSSTFEGILAVTHSWTSGKPCPLVCFINGSASNADGYHAEQLTKDSFYAPSASNNQSLSFTALRFVIDDDARYIEVKFKANSKITVLNVALSCNHGLTLVPASISTATSDKVLKTIEFSWGGVIGLLPITYNSTEKGGAHDDQGNLRGSESGLYGYVGFGSLDLACECIGRACEDIGLYGESECPRDQFERGDGFLHHRVYGAKSECSCKCRYDSNQHSDSIEECDAYCVESGRRRADILSRLRIGKLATVEESHDVVNNITVARKEVAYADR